MWDNSSNIWINRAERLNEDCFSQLVGDYYHVLFNFGLTFCPDEDLLKDTIQDLFLSIWEKGNLPEIKSAKNYLLKSLRNNLYRSMRKRKLSSFDEVDELDLLNQQSSIEDIIISDELAFQSSRELEASIARLSAKQKEVVFLKYYQGLSNDEIAEILAVNKQSVANAIHRIITTLRKNLPANYAALTVCIQLLNN